MKSSGKLILAGTLFALIIFTIGCAAPPKPKLETAFYPAPPQLPRYQFLVSYRGAKDIGGGRSSFDAFITGEKGDRRQLVKPYGIAMYEGKIYVCDTGGAVMVFDLQNRTYGQIKGGHGPGKLVQPINISIDSEGNKYVTDTLRNRVVVFDKNDEYAREFGLKEKWKPVDAVRYADRLYVTDPDNSEIVVFDLSSGEVIKRFGKDSLDRPLDIAFDGQGYLYVSDAGRFQVVKFDRDGHFIKAIGKLGLNYGHFQRPRGVAVDRNGMLYVVDAAFYNVQVFREKDDRGQLLTFFGEGGTGPGNLILPAQVALNYDDKKYFEEYISPNFEAEYLVLVTSQFGERMVSVFAYGKDKGSRYPTDDELDEELRKNLLENAKKEFKQNVKPEADKGD